MRKKEILNYVEEARTSLKEGYNGEVLDYLNFIEQEVKRE